MEIQIDDFGRAVMRVPLTAPEDDVRKFFLSKREWAEMHAEKLKRSVGDPGFTEAEVKTMSDAALRIIPPRVRYFAEALGVPFGRITVRNQVTKWGSCTAGGDLNFNCMLAAMPEKVLDSVVVHELCHIMHRDHSPAFYKTVRSVMPDYDVWRAWLRENGSAYMRRMRIYREGGVL